MKNIFYVLILIIIAGAGWFVFSPRTAQAPADESALVDEQPLPSDSLVGVWRSADDANFVRTIYENGGYMDSYEGSPEATTEGPWITFTKDSAPEGFAYPLDEGVTYLQLDTGAEALSFKIVERTATTLVLIYLDRGGVLTFTRE